MDSDRISSFSYADCHNDDKKLGVRFSLCLKILPDSTLSLCYECSSILRGFAHSFKALDNGPAGSLVANLCLLCAAVPTMSKARRRLHSSLPTLALVPQLIWALELFGRLVLS